jgi:hypothetical protein
MIMKKSNIYNKTNFFLSYNKKITLKIVIQLIYIKNIKKLL